MNKRNKILMTLLVVIVVLILIWAILFETDSKAQTVSNNSNTEVLNYEYEENNSFEQSQNITRSTSSYTPENIDRSNNSNNNSSFDTTNLENRSVENVKVEIVEETVTANGLTVVITDNNDISYTWDPDFYKIEQKINNTWQEVSPNKPLESILIGYNRNENNQFKFKINWTQYYGTLENGTYRVVEIPIPFNGETEYVYAYSNEFEIKN